MGQSGGSFVSIDIGNGFLILIWLFTIGVFAIEIWTLIIVKGARMDVDIERDGSTKGKALNSRRITSRF